MKFSTFPKCNAPTLLLIPGLGVSHEVFFPLIELLKERFEIITAQVDGFILHEHSSFTSIDDQAVQVIHYLKEHYNGRLDCAYGLSLGGKIVSRVLERNEVKIQHAFLDGAPLLALPRWVINPLRYLQCANVWSCYHWPRFWKWVFHCHYFDVLLDECKKVYPFGGARAVIDGYRSVYTNQLHSIHGQNIHYWYGTKEAFVAKAQVKHLLTLFPDVEIEEFSGMNHGQILIDHPEVIAQRIIQSL